MKKILSAIILAVMLASVLAVCVSADAAELPTAHVIYGTPFIDGEVEALWDKAQINLIDKTELANDFTAPVARFRAMYDDNYLYFLVEVEDHTMADIEWEMQGNSWYNKDGIAFEFSPDYNREPTTTQVAPAFWFIIRAFGTTANYNQVPLNVFHTEDQTLIDACALNSNAINELNDEKTGLKYTDRMYAISYKKDASGNLCGYTLESKINLKARYDAIELKADTKIGFDMHINDNNKILLSTARDAQISWTGDCNHSYKDDSLKGTLVLDVAGISYETENEPYLTTAEAEVTTAPEDTTKAADDTTKVADDTTKPADDTTKPADDTTAEPADTSKKADDTTAKPADTTAKPADTTVKPEEKKGCGSFSGVAALAVVALIGAGVAVVKKVY